VQAAETLFFWPTVPFRGFSASEIHPASSQGIALGYVRLKARVVGEVKVLFRYTLSGL